MSEVDKLYSTPEAAKELGVTAGHMRTMIVLGQAHPARRIGNAWLFTSDEIERLRNRPKSKGGRPKAKAQSECHA